MLIRVMRRTDCYLLGVLPQPALVALAMKRELDVLADVLRRDGRPVHLLREELPLKNRPQRGLPEHATRLRRTRALDVRVGHRAVGLNGEARGYSPLHALVLGLGRV